MNATPKTLWHQGQANPHVVYDEDNVMICNAGKAERAGLIVRAVNSFDALTGALQRLTEKVEQVNTIQHSGGSVYADDWGELYQLTNEANAALALASRVLGR